MVCSVAGSMRVSAGSLSWANVVGWPGVAAGCAAVPAVPAEEPAPHPTSSRLLSRAITSSGIRRALMYVTVVVSRGCRVAFETRGTRGFAEPPLRIACCLVTGADGEAVVAGVVHSLGLNDVPRVGLTWQDASWVATHPDAS